MKIAFFGTPQFAADILSGVALFPEFDIILVVSQPDMPVGRKQELLATPVKQVALEMGIEVLQPEIIKNNKDFFKILNDRDLDFIVVVAYGKIIPKKILDIPRLGCINLHGSILPKYRGASPVQAAIKAGEKETGLTTMFMSERMDEGDILQIAKIDIDIIDTSEDIFCKFIKIGPELLRDTLHKIVSGEIQAIAQNHLEATYCGKILKEQGEIFFQKQSAQEIYNIYRAFIPWPGIYTWYNGKRVVIEELDQPQGLPLKDTAGIPLVVGIQNGQFLKLGKNRYGIVCVDGHILELKQVKPEGKKSMDITSFVNGNQEVLSYQFS